VGASLTRRTTTKTAAPSISNGTNGDPVYVDQRFAEAPPPHRLADLEWPAERDHVRPGRLNARAAATMPKVVSAPSTMIMTRNQDGAAAPCDCALAKAPATARTRGLPGPGDLPAGHAPLRDNAPTEDKADLDLIRIRLAV
jgi:hypothetical protein